MLQSRCNAKDPNEGGKKQSKSNCGANEPGSTRCSCQCMELHAEPLVLCNNVEHGVLACLCWSTQSYELGLESCSLLMGLNLLTA